MINTLLLHLAIIYSANSTSSGFYSNTIEDKAVPFGIPPFNGESLKPETVSAIDSTELNV